MRSSTGPESPNTNWMVQHPLLTITSLAQLRQQDPAGGQPGGFRPGIDGHLGPPRHGDGAHAAALAFQIHNRPAAVALLHVLEGQLGHFVPAQATPQHESNDYPVAFAF